MWNVIFLFTGSFVQRCVVLHRDEKGYGLTVSGDNPVFVQDVKESECVALVSGYNHEIGDLGALSQSGGLNLVMWPVIVT